MCRLVQPVDPTIPRYDLFYVDEWIFYNTITGFWMVDPSDDEEDSEEEMEVDESLEEEPEEEDPEEPARMLTNKPPLL